jgi:hypothetical protein
MCKKKGGGGGQTQNIDVWCIQMLHAPKNETVCENIKQKNRESEYRIEKFTQEKKKRSTKMMCGSCEWGIPPNEVARRLGDDVTLRVHGAQSISHCGRTWVLGFGRKKPCPWRSYGGSIGRVDRMGDQEAEGAICSIVWLEEECIETYNGLPCKVYNSVPVVLYLKPFRTTECTDCD